MQPISITRSLVSSKLVLLILIFSLLLTNSFVLYSHGLGTDQIYFGVNMKGYYTSMPQSRTTAIPMPENFFDHSLKLISDAGMNHVRFVFYWESYVRDPINFMLELESLAQAADKYNINVIYDNHQFHTSSCYILDETNGIYSRTTSCITQERCIRQGLGRRLKYTHTSIF